MTRKTIQLPVAWDRAYRKRDRSLSLALTTTLEIPTHEYAVIDAIVPATGWFLFSANRFEDAEIPTDDAPSEGKTQSQRIRAVLFRCWEASGKSGKTDEDFERYYKRRTEKIIEHFKQELD
jgi:hypothetical protein